jgi:hypothetical protein
MWHVVKKRVLTFTSVRAYEKQPEPHVDVASPYLLPSLPELVPPTFIDVSLTSFVNHRTKEDQDGGNCISGIVWIDRLVHSICRSKSQNGTSANINITIGI